MAMALSCNTAAAAATLARNSCSANPGITTTHCATTSIPTQAGSPFCGVSSTPTVRFPSPIGTDCSCGHGIRRRALICNFSRRNSDEVTTSSAWEDNCCHSISRRAFRVFSEEESLRSRDKRFSSGFKYFAMTQQATEKLVSPLPKGATEEDAEYMRMAVSLARKAIGQTSPNPMVGCVIVKEGQIVGQGFHPKAGEPHAEVFALREAGEKAKGGTAYVSLEPCNHTGRTPPCSQALVRAQVKRVVVGTVDPNPLVGGKGVETLLNAGIEVVVGVEKALCELTAETFFHRITTKKPFVTLRYRMSLDGALLDSCEERPEEGSHSSLLLQEHDAIVITDALVHKDPNLLSSEPGAKQPLRVVLAVSLSMPLESRVFDTTQAPTLVLTDSDALREDVNRGTSCESTLRSKGVEVMALNEVNLDSILDLLYQRGFNSVLLDSRGNECTGLERNWGLRRRAIVEQAAQKLVVVIQPVLSGIVTGGDGLSIQEELLRLDRVSTKVEGGDVIIEGYFPKTHPK